MKHITLGSLDVGRIGLGAAGMTSDAIRAGTDDTEAIRAVHRAIDLGVTLIDTAEFYGPFANEELLGRALKGRRDEVVLASKFGFISHTGRPPGVPDSSPANIKVAVEGSLRRLATDRIDLYYQHRVDRETPIEEVISVLADLVAQGKIRHIGLSEAWVDTIRRAHAVHPVTALQSEYSVWTRDLEEEVFPVLEELDIGLVPYAPLGYGFLTGTVRTTGDLADNDWRRNIPRFNADNFTHNLRIADEVQAVAEEAGATAAQVALAWVLSRGAHIVPIPGSERVAWVEQNVAADDLALTPEQLARLDGLTPAAGNHHNETQMRLLDRG